MYETPKTDLHVKPPSNLGEKFINILMVFFLFLLVAGVINGFFNKEPEVPTIEDRCTFVVKTNGEDFHISEDHAGTYKYELYATQDGYVEVWKCN